MLAQESAGTGPFGGMLAQYGVLLRRQDLPPLLIRFGDRVLSAAHSDKSSYDMVFRPAAVALAAAAVIAGCSKEAARPTERQQTIVPVGAVPAQRAAIRAVIHVSGVVVPAQGGEFLVLAPEPTRLADVMKAQGDLVKSGDILARFDIPSAAQSMARLTAEAAAAQAQLENARINHERVRGFVDRGLVARRELDGAERDLADAQAAIDRTRNALAAAEAG